MNYDVILRLKIVHLYIYVHIPSVAGGSMEEEIATTRDQSVRLQELVQFYTRLLSQGIISYSDEVTSARRGYQFLTGPSGISETHRKAGNCKEIC